MASDFEQLVTEATAGLNSAQRLQRLYDDVGWRIEEPSWAKARHILLHLTAINAELAALIEPIEHADHDGRAPDSEEFGHRLSEHSVIVAHLVFHAAQLANMVGADLGEELRALYRGNAGRFAPDSEFAKL